MLLFTEAEWCTDLGFKSSPGDSHVHSSPCWEPPVWIRKGRRQKGTRVRASFPGLEVWRLNAAHWLESGGWTVVASITNARENLWLYSTEKHAFLRYRASRPLQGPIKAETVSWSLCHPWHRSLHLTEMKYTFLNVTQLCEILSTSQRHDTHPS